MACYEDYIFQEYIDGELDLSTFKELEEHLLECTKCRNCLEKVRDVNDFVSQYMNDNELFASKKNYGKGVLFFMRNYKSIAIAACALILTVSLGAKPLKVFANSIMVLFKPHNIQSIKASDEDMKKWLDLRDSFDVLTAVKLIDNSDVVTTDKSTGEAEIELLGKVRYERNGGYKNDLTIENAKELVSFDLKAPFIDGKPLKSISIMPERTFTITLNETISKSLQNSGLKPLSNDMIGKAITMKIPAKAYTMYTFENHNWVYIEQTTLPEITSTDDVDYNRLCSIFKELPLLPEGIRSQLKNINDLKNILPLVFKDNVEETSINGVKAYICQTQKQETLKIRSKDGGVQVAPEMNEVKWIQDGILWSVSGTLTRNEILDVAKKIR